MSYTCTFCGRPSPTGKSQLKIRTTRPMEYPAGHRNGEAVFTHGHETKKEYPACPSCMSIFGKTGELPPKTDYMAAERIRLAKIADKRAKKRHDKLVRQGKIKPIELPVAIKNSAGNSKKGGTTAKKTVKKATVKKPAKKE